MNTRQVLELGLLSVLWGSVYALTRVGLDELSPLLVVFGRTAVGAIGLVPLALARPHRRLEAPPLWIAAIVLSQATIPLLLLTTGQQRVSSAQAGVLLATQPIFAVILTAGDGHGDRYGPVGLAAVAVGFVGVVLVLGPDVSGDLQALLGALLVLASSFSYALGSVLLGRRLPSADPITVAFLALGASALVLLVPAGATLPSHVPSARALAALVVLGVVSGGWALALFYRLVQQAGAARANLAGYLAPAVAVTLGVLVLDEHMTVTQLVGLALILGGSALATHRWSSVEAV